MSLLAAPLNIQLLRTLGERPTPLRDLRGMVGYPPVSTMRSYLRALTELGVIERHHEEDFPGSTSYSISRGGQRLLGVADVLQQWLEGMPEGPAELGSPASRSAIKALVDGWEAGLVRALAARPLALTELDRLIPSITYPALERRLTAMRQVGLLEPERNGRVTRCQVTPWLRSAVVPLAAAIGWESQCIAEQAPTSSPLDIEAVFLLVSPLLAFPADADGTCRMAVEFRRGADHEFAGVMMTISEGRLSTCVTRLEGRPDAWVSGSALSWARWLSEGEGRELEFGGEASLTLPFKTGLRSLISTTGA